MSPINYLDEGEKTDDPRRPMHNRNRLRWRLGLQVRQMCPRRLRWWFRRRSADNHRHENHDASRGGPDPDADTACGEPKSVWG